MDLATLVETRTEEGRRPAFLVRVREGAFEAHFHRTRTTHYTVTNQSDRPRVVYVERARAPSWELDEAGPLPEEVQRHAWRFRLEIELNSRAEPPVTERLAMRGRYLLRRFTMHRSGVEWSTMERTERAVRQSVSLPVRLAKRVRAIAKARRTSANRVLVDLIETGLEAKGAEKERFFALARRFKDSSDPAESDRLREELARLTFGD